jgi:bifunctional enzyme CysN/CysC
MWFTGLPASGKSTLAVAVERALAVEGRPAYRLDGDDLRCGVNRDLGFDRADRAENARRTAYLARALADAGVTALVALISPYRADREMARCIHDQVSLPFIEVFLDTPVELCMMRDPKGLYARARRGEIRGLTGVDAPYEAPDTPELVLPPGRIDDLVGEVLDVLRATL